MEYASYDKDLRAKAVKNRVQQVTSGEGINWDTAIK